MLATDETLFPNNVVKWVATAMQGIDLDVRVFKRSLRNTDPQQSIGVFAQAWGPDMESLEMQGTQNPGPQLPTIQEYILGVQAFVKDSDEERGLAIHSVLAQRTRSVLYTNHNLQVVLSQLSANLDGGYTESTKKWGVRTARYISGEISSQMLYLSTLEFWIQTETRQTN